MKKKDKVKIKFTGLNATDVTGSSQLVTYKDKQVLLDFGMYQCSDKLKMYQINSRKFSFSAKAITEIIVSHALHLDHYSLIPRLFRLGCTAKVYVSYDTKKFWKVLFEDNLKIINKDMEYLNKTEKKVFQPLYEQEDVDNMMNHVVEVDFDENIHINEYMYFRYSDAYHILNSAQVELFVEDKNLRKKIYYSGDLGNVSLKNKPFLRDLKRIESCNLAVVETTYAMNEKRADEKVRLKDRDKLKTAIDEVCIDKGMGEVVIASFATQRTQEILVELYEIYGRDKNFKIPIIVDSPLATKITELYYDTVEGKDRELLKKVLQWDNLKMVSEWKDSELILNDLSPKVVIACSGFAQAGRIRNYLKKNLPNESSMLVFIGYSSEDSLSGIIKEGKKKYLKIDGEEILNKAKVMNLLSFTSHIQHHDMIDYYSSINCENIFLCHSELSKRLEFAQLLQEEYKRKCKTTKVWVADSGLEFEV